MANNGFENVKYVGRRINELWIASKDEKSRRPVWKDETRLHTALLVLTTVPEERNLPIPGAFPSDSDGERDIAVDPLMPKIETMRSPQDGSLSWRSTSMGWMSWMVIPFGSCQQTE